MGRPRDWGGGWDSSPATSRGARPPSHPAAEPAGPGTPRCPGEPVDGVRRGADQITDVLGLPPFRRVFPAVVAGLIDADDRSERLSFDELAPARKAIAAAYGRDAEEQGFRSDVDGDLVVDVLIGAHIGYLLANGAPASGEVSGRLVDVVLHGLRRRSATPLRRSR